MVAIDQVTPSASNKTTTAEIKIILGFIELPSIQFFIGSREESDGFDMMLFTSHLLTKRIFSDNHLLPRATNTPIIA